MRGFHPPAKNPAVARGFRPASATAAQAQALNQAPDSIHAMVKPGEFVLPPDTVHAMGGPEALQGVVNVTHTPVRGFTPRAKPQEPRQFFANGGLVEDENPKRPNSFGDAAAAAQSPGVTQIRGLANDGGARANRIAQVPASIGTQPSRTPDLAAQQSAARGFAPTAQLAQLAEQPASSSVARGFSTTSPAVQPTANEGAGAGRGFVNPVGAKPGTPEAQQTAVAASNEVAPGVYQHGQGKFSDNAAGMGFKPGFTGQPNAQNMAAADALAGRSQQESMARVAAPSAVGFQPASVTAPTVRHSGNDWQARNDLRNAMVSATSITNDGGKWDKHGKGVVSPERAYAAQLAGTDAQLRGAQPGADVAAMRENAGIQREGMQQAGETQRSRLQQALADIRERRTAQHQDNQDGIARQRLAIDAARLGRAGIPSGYRPKTDGTLEAIPGGPADPTTQAGKKPLNDTQSKALQFGARMLQSGQNLDALADSGVTRPGDIKSAADVVGLGGVMNWTQSPKQQQVEQSQRDFVNAVLRRESGAAISNSEFDNARRQYFPQIGDDDKVIEQKRHNRELATRGVLAEVPYQQNRVQQVLGAAGQAQQGQQRAAARTGTINGRKVVQYADGSIEYAD